MATGIKRVIKIAIIMTVTALSVVEGAFFAIQYLVDPKHYQQEVLDVIKQQTGMAVTIEDDIRFSLLPSPKLIVTGLKLEDAAENGANLPSYAPNFSVKRIEVAIEPFSIFSKEIKFTSMSLIEPQLTIERAGDNTVHLSWLNSNFLKLASQQDGRFTGIPMFFFGGIIAYKDEVNNQNIKFEKIQANAIFGKDFTIFGNVEIAGKKLQFDIDSNKISPLGGEQLPFNLKLFGDNKNIFELKGLIDGSVKTLVFSGNFSLNSDNIENYLPDKATKSKTAPVTSLVSSGKINVDNGVINLSEISLDGVDSKGNGNAKIYWENWYPSVAVDMDFSELDYDKWKELLVSRMSLPKKDEVQTEENVNKYGFNKASVLPKNIDLKLNLKTEKLLLDKQAVGKARLSAVLNNGSITVNQCDMDIEGGGQLSIFGVVSQGGTGEIRFEGSMEAKGNSLHRALMAFYPSGSDLPEMGMGKFSIDGNLYITPNQLKLIEAKFVLEDTQFSGNLVTYLDGSSRIETQLKTQNVNFDFVRDELRKKRVIAENKAREEGKELGDSSLDFGISFAWLKNLKTRIDAQITVDGFTFMERKGKNVLLNIYAYSGDFRVSDMHLHYPDYTTDIDFNLNVKGIQPSISLALNSDQLDTHYFTMGTQDVEEKSTKEDIRTDAKKLEDQKKELANTNLPFDWMDGFNGTFDIRLQKLIHKNILLEKINLQAKLEGKQLAIEKLSFIYSQAETNIIGTVFGGKVPGVTISFSMSNADLFDVLESFLGIDSISGYTSLTGTVATYGLNIKDWLQQMEAKLLIASRRVKIKGINIDGVSNAVNVSRSSSDVVNNVNNSIGKGITEFSVDGSISVKNGVITTPGLELKSGVITGRSVGDLTALSRKIQLSTVFTFSNLVATPVPTMIMQISGTLEKPEINLDTSSLEDFVAKRNASK